MLKILIPFLLVCTYFYIVPDKAFSEDEMLIIKKQFIQQVEHKKIELLDAEVVKRKETIKYIETKGNCNLRGADGEMGCYQIMPNTWKDLTKKHLGEVKGYSTTTAEIVVYKELLSLKDLPPEKVFLKWNAGNAKKCSRGITKAGVPFDSCAYVKKSMKHYNTLNFDIAIK